MSSQIPQAVTWCLAAGLLVALALLVRQWLAGRAQARRLSALRAAVRARDEEARRLATLQLPALAHAAVTPPAVADPLLAGSEYERNLRAVAEQFRGAVERAEARADQNAKAALKGAMRALQGLANEQQVAISEMQERHDHPAVLRDLLEIDHANSQFGRRAQAIAVLCGSWPGRQRTASSLSDVVRGAKSRVRDYKRVEVRTQIELAVVSRAVEPVVLAVAELLDNAARHSQPNTTVEVNLQPAHNGACVVIDDAGVGMDPREARLAGQLLTGQRQVDVTRLGDPPQFGFAVIGVLAARYGFSVSVDTRSPYGGVRAVLFLPTALLTQLAPEAAVQPAAPLPRRGAAPARPTPAQAAPAQAAPAPAPAQAAPTAPAPPVLPAPPIGAPGDAHPAPPIGPRTAGGLPKRRRREPLGEEQLAEAARATDPYAADATDPYAADPYATDAASPEPPAEWTRDAEATARRLGAFARGTRAGRESEPAPDSPPPGYGRHAARPEPARPEPGRPAPDAPFAG
ncbi:ATP-binding protein [Kitasatospora sp. NBC_01287]|uniref:ATP-binding protein n=1 Tax=Kitasatospora sp. NBC_01287 TaxID=2903573 RepID=UPI00225104C3|nr:ATP-binding protein [Kitasatospora sp. NBC_01287]MCX4745485.1 ATP-binding protein [Kitasatospora sp. NBC_01287]